MSVFPAAASPAPAAPGRLPAIDALRGLALIGMFVFHLVWDLGFFGLIGADIPFAAPFMAYGHVIASTFLALVGASLVLATRGGLDWTAYGRRLAMIIAAAAAITVATYYLFPESFIFFGILHCIAAASIVALLFLRAPPWLTLAAAAAIAIAPLFIASPALDNIPGWSIGLSAVPPLTNDWRPFFPWAAATLAGVALMRLALAWGIPARFANWRASRGATRALVWGGRHSLLVYLVHQPVFLAVLFLVARAVAPTAGPSDPEEASFLASCQRQCSPAGDRFDICSKVCGCVLDEMKNANIWTRAVDGTQTAADRVQIDAATRTCSRKAAPNRGG